MNVLLIDEDKASMHYYVLALGKNGYKVTHCRNPDDAIQAITHDRDKYALAILDSAMPPGKIYESEPTEDGTLTGKLLFRDIRQLCPNIPVLILTNFLGLDWIQIALKEKNVQADRKISVTPNRLIEIVKQMVKK